MLPVVAKPMRLLDQGHLYKTGGAASVSARLTWRAQRW
jgi:hypothetical protein